MAAYQYHSLYISIWPCAQKQAASAKRKLPNKNLKFQAHSGQIHTVTAAAPVPSCFKRQSSELSRPFPARHLFSSHYCVYFSTRCVYTVKQFRIGLATDVKHADIVVIPIKTAQYKLVIALKVMAADTCSGVIFGELLSPHSLRELRLHLLDCYWM